jgi:DNA protecting protein DprA
VNTAEGKAWLALARVKGMGPKALWLIADYLASREKTASWLLGDPDRIKDFISTSKANISMPGPFEKDEEAILGREPHVTLLYPGHADFPSRITNLKKIFSLPALLYARGNIAILNRPAVAIVGKRRAGRAALNTADALASALAAKGINITSGYAAGIDTAAHQAALRAGGTTSVILAEGIAHFRTKGEIKDHVTAENILVLSQFEPDAKWAAYMAMTRNKLIGALSDAMVVIISGPERDADGRNSGTFSAALSALKMGIPVFVVSPGFFADEPPGNRELIGAGCHEWHPGSGIAPILEAIGSRAKKNSAPAQLKLFEN